MMKNKYAEIHQDYVFNYFYVEDCQSSHDRIVCFLENHIFIKIQKQVYNSYD